MSCNHDTVTNIELGGEYILVYCGTEFKEAVFVTGEVYSAHTVETFSTAQELIDRGAALGLRCTTEHLIKAMEHGAILPPPVMDELLGYIWDEDIDYIKRMEALGYTQ